MKTNIRICAAVSVAIAIFCSLSTCMAVETIYSRSADWDAASNKFISGTNYHGTVEFPAGNPSNTSTSWWSYHYYGANPAVGYDANTITMPASLWYELPSLASSYGYYNYSWVYDHDYVDRSFFEFLWYAAYREDVALRPAWIMALRHYPVSQVVSLDGQLVWKFSNQYPYAGASYAYTIGVLSADGTEYTPLSAEVFGNVNTMYPQTWIIADLGDIPEVQNIRLAAGESLVFAFRGSSYNWRMTQFWDGDVTITSYDGCAILPGDIDKDCKVTLLDFAQVAENWMQP